MIYFFILCIVLLVFRQWFLPGFITAGDFSGITRSAIEQVSFFPFLWSNVFGDSLGSSTMPYIWNHFSYMFPRFIFGKLMHISPDAVLRIGYLYPFLFFGFIGTYIFAKKYVSPSWARLSSLVFTVNTYSLLIIGGGQIGVALAYSTVPIVLYFFIKLNENITLKYSLLFGILFGSLMMFDLRIAYVTLFVLGIYFLFNIKLLIIGKDLNEIVVNIFYIFIIPLAVSGLLHAFWILPLLVFHQNPTQSIGAVYTSSEAVKFFSFADFSHTLSLLHPNWPENIFGKVYFLQPEFLVIPILAFTSLLFTLGNRVSNAQKRTVSYFALLGIVGVFLAKGANPPFGNAYLWLFEHIPGFIMLRDSTKFYLFIALSYAILIPFTLEHLALWLDHKLKKRGTRISFGPIVFVLFVLFWGFAHLEAVLGKLGGTFTPHPVPGEYIDLKDYLVGKEEFSRVLWIPARSRYGFFSDDRPGLSIEAIGVASPSSFISWIGKPEAEEHLRRYVVSDIIVPTDPLGELFVTDRAYDDEKRQGVVSALRADRNLTQVTGFGDIAVFQTSKAYGHVFFADTPEQTLSVRRIAPTYYEVNLPAFNEERMLVFSESYDPYWELVLGTEHLSPQKTADGIQQYAVGSFSGGTAHIRYRPQDVVGYGLVVSGSTLIVLIGYLSYTTIVIWKRKRAS